MFALQQTPHLVHSSCHHSSFHDSLVHHRLYEFHNPDAVNLLLLGCIHHLKIETIYFYYSKTLLETKLNDVLYAEISIFPWEFCKGVFEHSTTIWYKYISNHHLITTTYHTCLHLETYKHHSGLLCLKEQKHPYNKSLSMAVWKNNHQNIQASLSVL